MAKTKCNTGHSRRGKKRTHKAKMKAKRAARNNPKLLNYKPKS